MPHQTLLACDQEEDTDHEKHTDSKLLCYMCTTAFLKYQHGAADMSVLLYHAVFHICKAICHKCMVLPLVKTVA